VTREVQVGLCPCGELTGYKEGLCSACRMREFGQARRKYHWTPELHAMLKRAYCGKRPDLSRALDALARRTGWPRYIFKTEAVKLGITAARPHRAWIQSEIDYVAERIGVVSVRQIAKRLRRSVVSVQSKAEALRLSRRPHEGYNMADLQRAFGVHANTVRRWMERGLFGKIHDVIGHRVNEQNVILFLRKYPYEYDLRRIDKEWYRSFVSDIFSSYRTY
jgi:hypothetical protein